MDNKSNLQTAMEILGEQMQDGKLELTIVQVVQLLQNNATREDLSHLDTKIDNSTDKLEAKIGKLEAKFDKLEDKYDAKFDRLSAEIKQMGENLERKINESHNKLESKLSRLTRILITVSVALGGASWYICTHIYQIMDILHILSKPSI